MKVQGVLTRRPGWFCIACSFSARRLNRGWGQIWCAADATGCRVSLRKRVVKKQNYTATEVEDTPQGRQTPNLQDKMSRQALDRATARRGGGRGRRLEESPQTGYRREGRHGGIGERREVKRNDDPDMS